MTNLDKAKTVIDALAALDEIKAEILMEHSRIYNSEKADEWEQGEHYAYHRVLQMMSDKGV